jgi:hypothetical protein
MQEGQGPPDISAFMPEIEGTAEVQPEGQATSSLADGFLSNIPENDRAVVGRYVKDWDSGVTKRFQEIHNEYAPYKELGDVENLRQAMELYNMLDTQPEVIYEALKQHFDQPQISGAQSAFSQQPQGFQNPQQVQPAPQINPQLLQALSPILTPLQEKMDQQEQIIQKMADVIVSGNQATQVQQEDAQLDAYLTDLKETHGNFDESAILLYLYQNPGSTGEQAVAAWKESMQQYMGNAPVRQAPPVLTGGSVPANHVDVGSLESKQVRDLVANVMAASTNQQ